MNINAKTIITGLFGFPVEHSLSPDMHNSAFKELKLNYCYIAMPDLPDLSLNTLAEVTLNFCFDGDTGPTWTPETV